MENFLRMGVMLFAVFLTVLHICSAAKVSATTCTSSGTECSGIANSACVSTNCKCDTNYAEDLTDGNTCVLIVLATDACTEANTATDCTITNSACHADALVCVCSLNYRAQSGACKLAVGQTCSSDAVCGTNTNCATTCKCNAGYKDASGVCSKVLGGACSTATDCSNTVTGSTCSSSTCSCDTATDYVEKGDICVLTVSGTTCTPSTGTECDAISNAQCDTATSKCKCDDGYVQAVDACDQNAGGALKMTLGVLIFSFLTAFVVTFF